MLTANVQNRSSAGTAVVVAGAGVYVAAMLTVAVLADGQIRFTADTGGTIPMWHPWLAAAVGIALTLITPAHRPQRAGTVPIGWVRAEGVTLLALAVAFAVMLTALGPSDPNYLVLKLGLLVVVPLMLFAARRRFAAISGPDASPAAGAEPARVRHRPWLPMIPVLGWAGTYLALSVTHPRAVFEADVVTVVVTLLIGFGLNAVVEEVFYRRWLQTRWQRILGGVWPAVIVSSLAWACWHIAIQGSGHLMIDLANVVANQGVTGLFFGLMWRRYEVLWPLLGMHAVMNANPIALF